MATPGTSRRTGGKKKEHQDSLQGNISGLKDLLHGASYQVKIGIVVSLANAKKVLEPTEKFSFTVTAEDPTAGKFDDIVYEFQDGNISGTLKIYAQHKLSLISNKSAIQDVDTTITKEIQTEHIQESFIPKITMKDFIADPKNDFYIQQYFESFLEQPQTTNQIDLERLIICTNANLDNDAKVMWDEIDAAALGDSTISLDSYISSLFDKTGGKCYKLKTHYKRSALVRLLINAIKSEKEMVTWQRPLFKEYRAAILDIIHKDSISGNVPSFKFTKDFLDPSYSNSKPDYEAFRKEFKDQFQREFGFNETAWECFKRDIKIYVAENFVLDEKNAYPSSDSFPVENEEEPFKSFSDRFRLVCGAYNEQGLDDTIVEIWKNLYFGDEHLWSDRHTERIEKSMATYKLFKTYFNWMKDPFATALHSDDIKADVEKIENTLAYMKLEAISDNTHKKYVTSPFRISHHVLNRSVLNQEIKTKNLLTVETYDIQFGATVLSDMLAQKCENPNSMIFLEDLDFIHFSSIIEKMLRFIMHSMYLIIICKDQLENVQSTLEQWDQQWEKDILKDTANTVIVIKKTNHRHRNIITHFSCFHICDLTKSSWIRVFSEDIPISTTIIRAFKILKNNFQEVSIEKIIHLLDWGKQMQEINDISNKYLEIKSTYLHRPWIVLDQSYMLEGEKTSDNKDLSLLQNIKDSQGDEISFEEITKWAKEDTHFDAIFEMTNNVEEEHETIIGGERKKILILLGDAGFGKTTSLTWLAWHLRKQNPSSWVIRCNLSDHCSDFKLFTPDQNNTAGKVDVINQTDAIRMLYRLAHSSLQLEWAIAEKSSNCLGLSNGEATLNEDLMKELSVYNSIHLLVFKEKFNSGELVLLLDGFDEIAPFYKEVVLKFLALFEQFYGVSKLYLTSRPYDLKEQFEKVFNDSSFFQLKPLTIQDKACMLYKMMMKKKWCKGYIDDEELSDFYKVMSCMLLCSLGDLTDIPINLIKAVNILADAVFNNNSMYLNLSPNKFKDKLVETVFDIGGRVCEAKDSTPSQ